MGLSKLLAKAEELANKELTKLQQQQQAAAAQQQLGQPGWQQTQPYAAPVIITQQPAAPAGFSTPPPSPPPYTGSVFAGRPSTPPAQPTHAMQQPSPATPAAAASPGAAPALTPSPSSRGRKKALLIACSYPGTKAQLRGPGNDIQCMHYLLINRFGFSPSQIVVLVSTASDGG